MERKMAASFCFFSGRRRCGSKHDVLTIFLIIGLLLLSSSKSVGVHSFLLRSPLQLSPASKLCAAADVDSAPSSKKKRRTFDENYERLKEYNAEHGNCNVPPGYKPDKTLANFVNNVRLRNRAGRLKEDQRVRLEAIGFVYNPQADTWNKNLERLIAYRKENGHCNVPDGYKPDKTLANFVKYMREQNRAGTLSEDHRVKLDAIGFVYDPLADTWNKNLERLIAYRKENCHCNVPDGYKPDKTLANFVKHVRAQKRAGTLTEDQRVRLDAIGFVYDPLGDSFNKNMERLITYRKENGHCNVPQSYKPDKTLAQFVKHVRRQHRAGLLAEEHREKLDAIGFVYDPLVDTWNKNLEQLIAYRKENGHCIVSTSDRNLSYWVSWIRQTPNMLSESQRKELDSLGFIWTDALTTWADRLWNEKLERLKAYKVEHGHTRVPRIWDQDKTLGGWVSKQRGQNRKGTLREDRKATLEALGFEWEINRSPSRKKYNTKHDEKWLQQYHKLEEFKARYGHTNTPKLGDDPKLGKWVAQQRECYRQGILRKDREEALERLGFQWAIRQETFDRLWMEKYNCLLEFKDDHGHVEVPNNGWTFLYKWCGQQRKRHSKGYLEPDREKLLEEIGFDWDFGPKR